MKYSVTRITNSDCVYNLDNGKQIFASGDIYTFDSCNYAGLSHINAMDAYRNIALATKRGDFVIDWYDNILNGMWESEALKEGNILIHIVNGSIKQLCDNRTFQGLFIKTEDIKFSVNGYSPCPVSEDDIIKSLKVLKLNDRLQLNSYLTKPIL